MYPNMRNMALLCLWASDTLILWSSVIKKPAICCKSWPEKLFDLWRSECMRLALQVVLVTTKNTAICHSGLKILEKQASKQAKPRSLLAFVMVFSSVQAIKGFYNNRSLAALGNSKIMLNWDKCSWFSGEMLVIHFKAALPCWASSPRCSG